MSQNKIKVLLADDNKDFCDVVAGHLNQQEDMSVISVAVDGIDAMNKIRDTRPDVAIIDGIMPRLDGLGVLERLQKNDEEYRPITIILSALSQDKVVQKARRRREIPPPRISGPEQQTAACPADGWHRAGRSGLCPESERRPSAQRAEGPLISDSCAPSQQFL